MRAKEFTKEEPKIRFADGYIKFSEHFEDRLLDHKIDKREVLQLLHKLEVMRSIDLIKMPFVPFVVRTPNLSLAIYKQLDKHRNTEYVVATAHRTLKAGEDEDVIYLEEDQLSGDQVLQYVKRAHAPEQFDIDSAITDHPSWELKNIPLSQLKLDPEGEVQDPYGRVNWVDWDKVQDLMPKIGSVLKRMPIVVDSQGWIIDGNHRATAAAEAGLKSVPAYVPTALNEDTSNSQWLYHATYRPLLKSIKAHGLGGDRAQAKWEDSKPGVVYLARDPDVAESYAESSDVVLDEWLDQIIVFKIRADQLDPSRLFMDQNVQGNTGDTLEYHGVIPVASLSLTENFADGKVKGKSRPGRVKRAGASCDGSVTDLRAKARKYGGERGKMYHWCANMKSGKKNK